MAPIAFLVILLLMLIPSNSSPNFQTLSVSSDPFGLMGTPQLRRAPHVFSKVLELPLNSNSDVSVEDLPDCFKFTADFHCPTEEDEHLRVLIVEPHPGIKKVLIRHNDATNDSASIDALNFHVWRTRLPENTSPETAIAAFHGCRLLVTVPKII